MKKLIPLILIVGLFTFCTEATTEFTHSYTSIEGVGNAKIIYAPANADLSEESNLGIYEFTLMKEDMIIPKVEDDLYSIRLIEEDKVTSFEEIPAKFINMDANVEVTRNIFQSYFPEEWAPMKGSQYSSLYIQNTDDLQVFYIKTVYTGTNEEIGKHSEDY